jgi:hypothetical protein
MCGCTDFVDHVSTFDRKCAPLCQLVEVPEEIEIMHLAMGYLLFKMQIRFRGWKDASWSVRLSFLDVLPSVLIP